MFHRRAIGISLSCSIYLKCILLLCDQLSSPLPAVKHCKPTKLHGSATLSYVLQCAVYCCLQCIVVSSIQCNTVFSAVLSICCIAVYVLQREQDCDIRSPPGQSTTHHSKATTAFLRALMMVTTLTTMTAIL